MSSPAISARTLGYAATRPSRWLIVGVAATAVASLIGVLAFVFGEQPIRGDGLEYRRLGTVIAS